MKGGAGQGKSKEVGGGHIGSGQVGGGRARKMSGKIRKIRGKKAENKRKTRKDAGRREKTRKSQKERKAPGTRPGCLGGDFGPFQSIWEPPDALLVPKMPLGRAVLHSNIS